MAIMLLPVSKTALDRLGNRLTAGDEVDEADRVTLAQVVGAYQQVLDEVKAHLGGLGYPATTRVKTTGTLIEKLRRESPMRLSQMQDLAGARIVVRDRPAQDNAVGVICKDCETCARSYKVVDRRDHPSHGYRAVHILMQWERIPVEVQVRTELQDVWAQMIERLADRWGRGIRYGEDPDSMGESEAALNLIATRRGLVASFITISDLIAQAEAMRAKAEIDAVRLDDFGKTVERFQRDRATDDRPASEAFSPSALDNIIDAVERISPEMRSAMHGARDSTLANFAQTLHHASNLARKKNDAYREKLHDAEIQIRERLQTIAGQAERGEV